MTAQFPGAVWVIQLKFVEGVGKFGWRRDFEKAFRKELKMYHPLKKVHGVPSFRSDSIVCCFADRSMG